MNIIEKTKNYLTGVAAEGKRVTWPGKRELWESTLVVISFIFILAATMLVYDKVIKFFLDFVLAKPGA
jgi:preprotein translocase SecE subunit